MKISPQKKFILAISLTFFFQTESCFSWDGIDPKKNSTIEIQTGNIVREGSIIDFYDSDDGNFHTGKVLTMNSVFHGTEIVVEDFTAKHKERIFLMNE